MFFWLQLRAVDSTTGEFGTAALSVQVLPGKTTTLNPDWKELKHDCAALTVSVAHCRTSHLCSPAAMDVQSPSNIGYRPGDMVLLGLIMAALLILSIIVIGFLISRLGKENTSLKKICEVSFLAEGKFIKSKTVQWKTFRFLSEFCQTYFSRRSISTAFSVLDQTISGWNRNRKKWPLGREI